jgi:hypothetical protein
MNGTPISDAPSAPVIEKVTVEIRTHLSGVMLATHIVPVDVREKIMRGASTTQERQFRMAAVIVEALAERFHADEEPKE